MPVPDLDATVRGLYRAATAEASWDETLTDLRDALGAADLQLQQAAPRSDRAPAPAGNPRWPAHPLPRAGGERVTLDLGTQQCHVLSLQITWPVGRPPDAAMRAWLDRLAPHLQDALQAAERLRQWPARSRLGGLLLETLAHPAWLLQADGGILQANAAARRPSVVARWWQADNPVLSLRDATDQQAVDTARLRALAAPQARPVLMPPAGAADGDTRQATAQATPLQARWLLRRLVGSAADPVLLAILFDPRARHGADDAVLSAPLLAGAFGFTPAESRVAVCLAQGCTVRVIASRLDVAPSTVRSHLDAVVAKLGVARKLDAVRLLAQGGWMWRAWPGEGMQDA